jgi:succinate dehydrogenase / fumarate reductase cytochrome b subunit
VANRRVERPPKRPVISPDEIAIAPVNNAAAAGDKCHFSLLRIPGAFDCSCSTQPYNSFDDCAGADFGQARWRTGAAITHKERILKRLIQALSSFWLVHAFTSSIGKKLVMAVTGLALCGFLVVHLGGNLLLYVGADDYNRYAHTLHAQQRLLLVAEIGLLILFLGHILLALKTDAENRAARPTGYAVKQTKMDEGPLASPASSVMMVTGIVVLAFLLVHLSDFNLFDLRHDAGTKSPEPFVKALVILRDPISAIVYIVGSAFLGYHVLHGFQSAFQTLGVNHPKYTPIIRFFGFVLAITVAIGFGSFPFWAWVFKH